MDSVTDCMGFRGALRGSSAYSSIGLALADLRVLLNAARDALRSGLLCARRSVRRARDAHCDRILWRCLIGTFCGMENACDSNTRRTEPSKLTFTSFEYDVRATNTRLQDLGSRH